MILGLSLLNYLLRFARWQHYVNRLGHAVPLGRNLVYYLAGFAFTVTPGKFGEAVRSIYLKPHGMGYKDSLAAFFVERLLDVLAIAVLACLGALSFASYRGFVLLSCLVILVLTWGVSQPALPAWLSAWSKGCPAGSRLARVLGHLADLLQAAALLLHPAALYSGLLLGLLAWAAEGVALFLILNAMSAQIAVLTAVGIYAVSILVGALSFLPGGLGGTEAVMGLLLALAGASPPVAISATLLCRVTTLWFAVVIGLIAVGWLESGRLSVARS